MQLDSQSRGELRSHGLRSWHFGLVPLCESVVRGFSITSRTTQFAQRLDFEPC